MKKQDFEKYLNLALSTGADFAEIYYENSKETTYKYSDSKLDTINSKNTSGIGIRIIIEDECYYTSTNIQNEKNILNTIEKLILNIKGENTKKVILEDKIKENSMPKIPHNKYSIADKKKLLNNIDKIARSASNLISQVFITITEKDKEFIIANSNGKFIEANSCLTRIATSIYAERNEVKEYDFTDFAASKGYEILEDIDIENSITKSAENAVKKLDAIDFKGGELPVIIAPGFGAVIFHEACGHGLEATSVAPKLSVFSEDHDKKIASEKVTLIDDGTIVDAWGSSKIDDEGNETRKNILIENGILKNYLVDEFNSKKMQLPSNGCSRRENYNYPPTSRMSNTFLAPSTDKLEDMIKSIELGIYCEKMSGGSVSPATGDFNFAVDTARLIKNGELKEYLKGITLIGNSKEILKNVEMVSDDLAISAGYCGSKSGMIPVTIGQPSIKVSKILVGGKE